MPPKKYITPDGKMRCSKGDACIHPDGPWLPATTEYFCARKDRPLGIKTTCRACCRERFAEWAAKNPKYRTAYYAKHIEEEHIRNAKWRAEHPEYQTKWFARNYDKVRARQKAYNHKYPEVGKLKDLRRRTRKRNLPYTFDRGNANTSLAYWKWKCAYCGCQLNQLSMFDNIETHFDHFIPLSDTRADNPGTVPNNMIPTCDKCNHSKCNHNPIEWITRKFGARKAKKIIAAIEAYFASLVKQP